MAKIEEQERKLLTDCLYAYSLLQRSPSQFTYSQKKVLVIDDESYNCKALFQIIKSLKLPDAAKRID